jgi:hypothetical protein
MTPGEWIGLATFVGGPAAIVVGKGWHKLSQMADDMSDVKRRVLGDPRYGIPSLVGQVEDHEERITNLERKAA